jgi:hypothetical protein
MDNVFRLDREDFADHRTRFFDHGAAERTYSGVKEHYETLVSECPLLAAQRLRAA